MPISSSRIHREARGLHRELTSSHPEENVSGNDQPADGAPFNQELHRAKPASSMLIDSRAVRGTPRPSPLRISPVSSKTLKGLTP